MLSVNILCQMLTDFKILQLTHLAVNLHVIVKDPTTLQVLCYTRQCVYMEYHCSQKTGSGPFLYGAVCNVYVGDNL